MAEPVYKSQSAWVEKGSSTLIITCSSNTYYPCFREFLEMHLQLPEGTFDYLSVPGGPQFLMLTEYLPKFAWAGQRWVKFLVERHRLRRVILLTHEDCTWNKDERLIPAFLHKLGRGASRSAQEEDIEDLRRMARSLHELVPSIAVEAYYARRETDGRVGFLQML